MRSFIHVDVPQHLEDGTANPDWLAARLGRITGSVANDMLSVARKAGEGLRVNLAIRLALEQRTGKPLGSKVQTQAMKDGTEREPMARFAYEQDRRVLVERTGFLAHADLMAGASLDGHLGDFEGLISIKCPEHATHWDTVRHGEIELKYHRQILHEMWLTDALWCDFVSFHPDFDEALQLKVIRVERNKKAIEQHDADVRQFLQEVQAHVDAMRMMAEGIRAA